MTCLRAVRRCGDTVTRCTESGSAGGEGGTRVEGVMAGPDGEEPSFEDDKEFRELDGGYMGGGPLEWT